MILRTTGRLDLVSSVNRPAVLAITAQQELSMLGSDFPQTHIYKRPHDADLLVFQMRVLLTWPSEVEATPDVVASSAVVHWTAAIISAAVLVPAILLCGICMGKSSAQRRQPRHAIQNPPEQPAVLGPLPTSLGPVPSSTPPQNPSVYEALYPPYPPLDDNGSQARYPPVPLASTPLEVGPVLQPKCHQPNDTDRTGRQVNDPSLEAVEQLLQRVCTVMGGSVKPGKTLVQASIRLGINAVIADITTTCATGETALFFPNSKFKERHMNMYQHLSLRDSMPLVTMDTDTYIHKALGNVISTLESASAKQQELFAVWRYLAKLLRMFHMRGRYLRDVTRDNVVQVSIGNSHGWSLLEFARVAKGKRDIEKSTIPVRTVPPELAAQMLSAHDTSIRLSPAYDMWQLGILVYEALSETSYWAPHLSDRQILSELASPKSVLPHEERPVTLEFVHKILHRLMHRDPEQRFSSTALIDQLEADLATNVPTLNPSMVRRQATQVLES